MGIGKPEGENKPSQDIEQKQQPFLLRPHGPHMVNRQDQIERKDMDLGTEASLILVSDSLEDSAWLRLECYSAREG